jgi:hypothetical protein
MRGQMCGQIASCGASVERYRPSTTINHHHHRWPNTHHGPPQWASWPNLRPSVPAPCGPSPPPPPPSPIDAPCPHCLRHGDLIHARKGLTAAAVVPRHQRAGQLRQPAVQHRHPVVHRRRHLQQLATAPPCIRASEVRASRYMHPCMRGTHPAPDTVSAGDRNARKHTGNPQPDGPISAQLTRVDRADDALHQSVLARVREHALRALPTALADTPQHLVQHPRHVPVVWRLAVVAQQQRRQRHAEDACDPGVSILNLLVRTGVT